MPPMLMVRVMAQRTELLSQVLLNRFCDSGKDLIGVHDIRYGSMGQRTSRAIGVERNFAKAAPTRLFAQANSKMRRTSSV